MHQQLCMVSLEFRLFVLPSRFFCLNTIDITVPATTGIFHTTNDMVIEVTPSSSTTVCPKYGARSSLMAMISSNITIPTGKAANHQRNAAQTTDTIPRISPQNIICGIDGILSMTSARIVCIISSIETFNSCLCNLPLRVFHINVDIAATLIGLANCCREYL